VLWEDYINVEEENGNEERGEGESGMEQPPKRHPMDSTWTDAGFLMPEPPLFYVAALNRSNLRQSTLGMEDMSSTGDRR